MEPTFKIYFSDLTPDCQKRLLKAVGFDNPKDANWDMDIYRSLKLTKSW